MLIKCHILHQWHYDQINYHSDIIYILKGSIVTFYMLFMHYLYFISIKTLAGFENWISYALLLLKNRVGYIYFKSRFMTHTKLKAVVTMNGEQYLHRNYSYCCCSRSLNLQTIRNITNNKKYHYKHEAGITIR